MPAYYNFKNSEHQISYSPYLYNKKDTALYFIIGIAAIVFDISSIIFHFFEVGFGFFAGIVLILAGLHKVLFKSKIILIFNKPENALYKITPLGKKKLTELSNIYSIIIVSENMSYSYEVTNKENPSKKSIPITDFITNKTKNYPNVAFLETQIIPHIESLVNLKH